MICSGEHLWTDNYDLQDLISIRSNLDQIFIEIEIEIEIESIY